MTSLCDFRRLAMVVPLALVACGGTELLGNNDGGHKDGTTFVTPDGAHGGQDAVVTPESGRAPDTGAPPVDAGGIPCGTTTCAPQTQECCITGLGGAESCVAKGACSGGVPIGCSGPASCPAGNECCATTTGGIAGATVSCTSMPCMGYVLCQNDGDCTAPDTCDPAPFPGFKYCGRPTPDGGFTFDGGHHHREGGIGGGEGGIGGEGGVIIDAGGPGG